MPATTPPPSAGQKRTRVAGQDQVGGHEEDVGQRHPGHLPDEPRRAQLLVGVERDGDRPGHDERPDGQRRPVGEPALQARARVADRPDDVDRVLDLGEEHHRGGEEEREAEQPGRHGRGAEDVLVEVGLDLVAGPHGEVRGQEVLDLDADAVEVRERPDHRHRHHHRRQEREDRDVGEGHGPELQVLPLEGAEAGPERREPRAARESASRRSPSVAMAT